MTPDVFADHPRTAGGLAGVLDELHDWLARYIAFRDRHGLVLLTLWLAHVHAIDLWAATPRLHVTSALPGCGKTTVLEHGERLLWGHCWCVRLACAARARDRTRSAAAPA